jgi:hypothetical protein
MKGVARPQVWWPAAVFYPLGHRTPMLLAKSLLPRGWTSDSDPSPDPAKRLIYLPELTNPDQSTLVSNLFVLGLNQIQPRFSWGVEVSMAP